MDRIQTYHQTSPVMILSMYKGRSILPGIPCHIYVITIQSHSLCNATRLAVVILTEMSYRCTEILFFSPNAIIESSRKYDSIILKQGMVMCRHVFGKARLFLLALGKSCPAGRGCMALE